MARDPNRYKGIGKQVATIKPTVDFSELASLLLNALRITPPEGGLRNALQHLWGYVSKFEPFSSSQYDNWALEQLLTETCRRALEYKVRYLVSSSVLGELRAWINNN